MRHRRDPTPLRVQRRRRLAGCAVSFAVSLQAQVARAELTARAELLAPAPGEPTASSAAIPARGDALELRLRYRAPRECPSGSDFLETLQEHLAAGGTGAIDAEVAITRQSAGREGYELTLHLRVAGQRSESVARAEACDDLMHLAALNASMARTAALGGAMSSRGALSSRGPLPPPAASIEPGPDPSLAADGGELLSEPGRAAGPGEPATRAFVLGEVRTTAGMLPRLAWGRGVTAGVSRGFVSLRLSATWWEAQQHAFSPERTSPIPLEFEQRSLELSPCAGGALSTLLRLDGCALLAGHRAHTSAGEVQVSGSIGAAALDTLSPWRGLQVAVESGLAVPIFRPSFGADALRAVFEPSTFQPSMRVAVGWVFGGEG